MFESAALCSQEADVYCRAHKLLLTDQFALREFLTGQPGVAQLPDWLADGQVCRRAEMSSAVREEWMILLTRK